MSILQANMALALATELHRQNVVDDLSKTFESNGQLLAVDGIIDIQKLAAVAVSVVENEVEG